MLTPVMFIFGDKAVTFVPDGTVSDTVFVPIVPFISKTLNDVISLVEGKTLPNTVIDIFAVVLDTGYPYDGSMVRLAVMVTVPPDKPVTIASSPDAGEALAANWFN